MDQPTPVEHSLPLPSGWSRLDVCLCVAALVLAVTGVAFDYAALQELEGFDIRWESWESLPGIVALTVAGAALRRYRDAWAVGTVLLVAGLATAAATSLVGISSYAFQRHAESAAYVQAVGLAIWPLSIVSALVFLPQVYPDGPIRAPRWRRVLRLSIVLVGSAMTMGLIGETVSASSAGCPEENINCAGNMIPMLASSGSALLFITSAVLGLAAWVHRWRFGGRVVRRQIGLLWGALLVPLPAFALMLFAPVAPIETYLDVAVSVSWRVLVVGVIVIAILRYDLYDIGAALRRSAVYVALTIGLVSIFLLVYIAVLAFVTRVSAGASAPWIAAVAATAVVLCAEPARRRINSRLDRKLFGDRGRPLEVLKRLDENVRSGDESAVLHTVAETVAHAVHSPAVAVGVQRESNVDVVVGKDEVDPESVVIPALHRGERVGELRVAPRSRRAAFSRADLVLLSHLGDQLGNLLYGFRQDREVAAQRQRVMTAARDERNRMASDLHDGLAPLLAGAGLAADGLRRGLPADSSDAADAARLAERLRQAATQVREIAYGLRSNPLADQGLAVMVIDHLNTLMSGQVPRFDCHADIPRLPAIVEQEVYLVLLEATNNVVRHARAQHCTVDLTVHDAMLQVVVEDDGIGLSRPYVSGMGLTSMRSRVTALGGALDLTSASVQGTRMVARIPVTTIDTD